MRIPERFKAGIRRVRPYGPEMAKAVDEFQRAHFRADGRQIDPACRGWLFEQNPYAGDDGPAFWVCERDGRMVGQQTEMPVALQVGDQTRPLSWAIDLMVDPPWRLRGVGPAMIATVLGHSTLVGVLYASKEGYPAFVNSGCVDLGPMPVYRRPLDARRALRLPRVPAVVRRLSFVVAPLLRLADGVAAAVTRSAGARLVPIERFDRRVDEVWSTAAEAYPVLVRRDLTAVAWKIDQRPDSDLLRRHYLVRRGRTIGYVVVRYASSSGERTAMLVDYLAPPRWVVPLLLGAARAARRDGAVAMTVRTRNPAVDRALRLTGFLRLFGAEEWPIHHLIHCTDDTEVCAAVTRPDSWFLTAADGDLEPGLRRDEGA